MNAVKGSGALAVRQFTQAVTSLLAPRREEVLLLVH
jgi:hypothetical protein